MNLGLLRFYLFIIAIVFSSGVNAINYYSRSDGTWSNTNGGADCSCSPASDNGWLETGDYVEVNHGNASNSSNFSVTGTPTIVINSGGKWSINGSMAINGGTWTIAAHAELYINGSVTDVLANAITVNGHIHATGSMVNSIALTGSGSIDADGGYTENGSHTGITLPVELVDFKAKKAEDKVELIWTTESEFNSDYYSILRSSNGSDFVTIGTKPAAGNSLSLLKYSYLDYSPVRGLNYYQLQEFDVDGKMQQSTVIAINTENEADLLLQVFPNPAAEKVMLYFNSVNGGNYKVVLLGGDGSEIYTAQLPAMKGENQFTFSMEPYPAAQYFIQLICPNGELLSVPLIIKK